jgi:MFS-type transporter involved in bile tolerance (Atg22 family)
MCLYANFLSTCLHVYVALTTSLLYLFPLYILSHPSLQVSTKFKNGVLTVIVSKLAAGRPSSRKLTIDYE